MPSFRTLVGAGLAASVSIAAAAILMIGIPNGDAKSTAQAPAAPAPMPVSVAVVEPREVALWDEFSGRLEAVERVEVRSRVAGVIQAVHFREGALVQKGDLLVKIDPDPYAAEVARAEAQVAAAEARLALNRNELERGRQLWDSRAVSRRDLDQRQNGLSEAEANLRAAQASLQAAQLNLDYTEIRAPVAGRIGKLEVTVGNLVAAGPGAPVLATLVSVDPIYASFNADEEAVIRALKALGPTNPYAHIERIPVQLITDGSDQVREGKLQLVDNQVDTRTGTVRLRAVFDNPGGQLIPGQYARLRMGQATKEPLLLVSERAVGTDQNKRFVLVIGDENKAQYREVALGASLEGLRVVTDGLKPGERIVVNGLQRVRPGAVVAPKEVAMQAPQPLTVGSR